MFPPFSKCTKPLPTLPHPTRKLTNRSISRSPLAHLLWESWTSLLTLNNHNSSCFPSDWGKKYLPGNSDWITVEGSVYTQISRGLVSEALKLPGVIFLLTSLGEPYTHGGDHAYLPWLHFIVVVILEDSFVAQSQPPRYPLLVLGHGKEYESTQGQRAHTHRGREKASWLV